MQHITHPSMAHSQNSAILMQLA